jgi:hypothetical protein
MELNNKDRVTYWDNINNLIRVGKFVLTRTFSYSSSGTSSSMVTKPETEL